METYRRKNAAIGRASRCLFALMAVGLWMIADPTSVLAREPMEVDDKPGLYQRVLSRPDAVVLGAPGGDETGEPVPPFTAFYVFGRETVDGAEWIEVGPGRAADPSGWVSANQTLPWDHTMVLAFGNPVGRLPVLFFDDQESLLDVVLDERLPVIAPELTYQARAGEPPEGSGIISIEPEEWVDFTENFYLLPILEAEQTFLASGVRAKIVEIASIPFETATEEEPGEESPRDYNVGVMFVVDTTTSMEKYIDRTRETVRRIFDRLSGSPVGDRISFGMVAYRDSLDPVPDLGYLTEVVAPLSLPPDHEAFLTALNGVEVSTVSSAGFNEDGLAGMMTAIGQDEWKNFGGRYIIFLSDAGVRDADDPFSSTGLSPAAVNREAREKTIAVVAMLLATPTGTAYHEHAEGQYMELASWEGRSSPVYYLVPDGALDDFGPTIDEVVDSMVEQIQGEGSAAEGDERDVEAEMEACAADSTGVAGLSDSIRCAGYAMRLAWLGRERDTVAPSVFMGWAPDFALDDPRRKAFEVRVLLTKEQLSNLASALESVLEAGSTVDTDPSLFFDQLRTIVLRAAVDPSSVDPDSIDSLGDLLDPFLADLPYESQLMGMSEDTWLDAGPARQAEILATVRSKVRAYQYIHDDADRWIRLHEDAPSDELVYPIPLAMLP